MGTLLIDLFKVYDCLPHNRLPDNVSNNLLLEAYGLHSNGLTFILGYLTSRKRRAKIGTSNNNWTKNSLGNRSLKSLPQGSILGPSLFKVINNILFVLEKPNVCHSVDDNTLCSYGKHLIQID